MLDQETSDSIGATEEPAQLEQAETETEQVEVEAAETVEDSESELEYFQIGDIEATADEIQEWKEAHSKKSDTDKAWTQKTQALAAEKDQLSEKMRNYDEKLESFTLLESEIDSFILGDLAGVDLDKVLQEEGTDEYLRLEREIKKRRGLKANLSNKLKQAQEESIKAAQEATVDMLGWSDSEKQQSDIAKITEYKKETGIPDSEWAKINSPHVISALLEAAKYRELLKKKETTAKKVKAAPKVAKPSQPKQTNKPRSLAERMYPNMN